MEELGTMGSIHAACRWKNAGSRRRLGWQWLTCPKAPKAQLGSVGHLSASGGGSDVIFSLVCPPEVEWVCGDGIRRKVPVFAGEGLCGGAFCMAVLHDEKSLGEEIGWLNAARNAQNSTRRV